MKDDGLIDLYGRSFRSTDPRACTVLEVGVDITSIIQEVSFRQSLLHPETLQR